MYWGFKTTGTFVAWVCFAVFIVTGSIWVGIGASGMVGCDYCKNQFINNYTPAKPTLPVNVVPVYASVWWNSTLSPVPDGCIPPAFEFSMYYPKEAALNGTKSADEFYGWCINSGPLAGTIAGSVVLLAGLCCLLFFFCARKPEEPGTSTVMVGLQKV
ncbi:hypothetical protein HYH02_003578 [Chlamydomonas schloesseri]|uniref:Uncharacterized protein n=1 Tax=Chlamydomonas schloesseri TaxID=2026947 RepID=A0A835WQU6_9CHLO|nr:hypothetical protein HYH02_003578 [Chlamydomonas schloesseri]|eukprot:KAG2451802.1 hypothetical protein HYH02_003578 [Chlamydomonas schloesseri]